MSVEVTRTIFVGPSAAGKSSLKHLLVHNHPKAVKTSTPVMETPEVVTKRSAMDFSSEQYAVQEGTSTWQSVNSDIMKNSLHACITSKAYEEKNQYPVEVEAKEAKDKRHKAKNINEQDQSDPTENGQPKATVEEQSDGHPHPKLPQSDLASLDRQYSQLLQEMDWEGEKIRLRDASFIHLLDTGGQPSFQDVLPLLLDVPCTYIQVFNASRSLNEQIPITYRANDHTVVRLDDAENGHDMMLRSFSSMQTMSQKCSKELASFQQKDSQSPQFRVFVVGTHKDELNKHGRLDNASKEVETFLKSLDGKPYYKSIQWDSVEGKPFFLINAMGANEREINDLREGISSKGSLRLDVPVMWFLCQEVTRCTPTKFFRLRDLEAFCRNHGFVDGENAASQFHALLQLLTLLGFYSFFNLEDVLDEDNFVCTDRGVFLKEVSTLLAVQFSVPTSAEMESFKETGILVFTQTIFKELGICQEIDAQWFLKALQHLGIAAQVHSKNDVQEYFIPAVLPPSLSIQDPLASVAPLCLTYKIEGGTAASYTYMPQGVFCRLAVELIRQGWNIIAKKSTRTLLLFTWDRFEIFLKESSGYISLSPQFGEEISPLGLPELLHIKCVHLLDAVRDYLSRSTEAVLGSSFRNVTELAVGFECPCKEVAMPHIAVPSKIGKSLHCLATGRQQMYSNNQHIWFSPLDGVRDIEVSSGGIGLCM